MQRESYRKKIEDGVEEVGEELEEGADEIKDRIDDVADDNKKNSIMQLKSKGSYSSIFTFFKNK